MSQVEVTTGLASDSETEIVSGVKEGDTIVTSITTTSATTKSSTTTSPFSIMGRSGGGNNRQFIAR